MAYNAECPTVFQTGNWQCSAASAAWVLCSMGIRCGQDDVVGWLGGNISPAVGLHDGSGRMLAAAFRARGLDAGHGPLSWKRALAMAGRQPLCMSGREWYHWTGVRSTDGRGLHLANPAPNWYGVGQYLDYDEWSRLGPWNAAWVNVEDEMSADLRATIERLRGELEMRERRDEELIRTMGYLHGDVVAAFRHAHEGLRMALDAADAVAPLREDIREEARGHLQGIRAALNTLETHTRP
jgi:hypothetical protein